MAVFIGWFLLWLAGSAFGPAQYHPPADVPPPGAHEASEGGAH